jgi:hypothetical protein
MTRVLLLLSIALFGATTAFAEAMSPGLFAVAVDALNVRLAANTSARVSGKLPRGAEVEVLEVENGWARISEYYDGDVEGLSGSVARWVYAVHLSSRPRATAASGADSSADNATDVSPQVFVVTAGSLNVRLAPGTSGKVASKLYRGQQAEVFEIDNGWARISEYYDGEIEGLSGKVARWVFAEHLGSPLQVPQQQVDANSPIARAIEASDDLEKHLNTFVWVSQKLVDAGECELSDFRDIGGWWRSAAHKPRSIYYTYCGGATNSHRIYVDTSTGQTFR